MLQPAVGVLWTWTPIGSISIYYTSYIIIFNLFCI